MASRRIIEEPAIKMLLANDMVVVAVGGGGIPVVRRDDGSLEGVGAVIDKDWASAVLATQLGARRLLVLTSVPRVALDFGQPTEREVERLTVGEARAHLDDGQFPPGSMGPKIGACIAFVEAGGEKAVISSSEQVSEALAGRAGTAIVPDPGVAP